MAKINIPHMGITGEDWPELDTVPPTQWRTHIGQKLAERQQAALEAAAAPAGASAPKAAPAASQAPATPAPAPGRDFASMLAQIQQNAPAPAAPQGGGLGGMISKAFQAYSAAPAVIDVPIKAGLTPAQVTSMNQQLLGEQELAARTAQAEKDSQRQDQLAQIQMQGMDLDRQTQQMKLAEMMMPKENIQIAPDGTVINLTGDMVNTKLAPAPLTAAEKERSSQFAQTLGLDVKQQEATEAHWAAQLAQDAAQHSESLAASRANAGGGTGDWAAQNVNGVTMWVNKRTQEVKPIDGAPPVEAEPITAADLMAGVRLARPEIDTAMENMIPPSEMVKIDGALGDLQGEDRTNKRSSDIRAYLSRSDPAAFEALMAEEQDRAATYAGAKKQSGAAGRKPSAAAPPDPSLVDITDPPSFGDIFGLQPAQPAPPPVSKTREQILSQMMGLSNRTY